jgi:hypothetical protein
MSKRKHITEVALGFFSNGVMLLHPKDLRDMDQALQDSTELAELAENCHIYLIVKHPRVSYVPDSIVVLDDYNVGKMKYSIKGINHEFSFRFSSNAERVEISEYPHTTLNLIRDNEVAASLPAYLVGMRCGDQTVRDLEVQYVGMSYAEGRRSAKDRLQSHSTLQQVLADLISESPDSETLLVLVEYETPQTLITFSAGDGSLQLEDDRDLMSTLDRQQQEITKNLQIALIEAALIKYFQPQYNDKYKKRFPHPTHKILDEVYSIDFSGLTVELNTEDLNARLFSPVQKPGHHHMASFDLHDITERRSIFNIMNLPPSGFDASDISGPLF